MGKFVSLYTGGKDSHTATLIAMKDYKLEPGLLLTILTPRDDSYLLHTANIKWRLLSEKSWLSMELMP
jgi:diphthamide synthase (EF-2-diphthine--ammonia ligase)